MNETPEWIKRLREHQTLHTGNCYCETDTRCDYDNRLIDFITTEKGRSYAEGFFEGKINTEQVFKKLDALFEKYHDSADERYGYIKYWNTLLGRLEDDLRTLLQEGNK